MKLEPRQNIDASNAIQTLHAGIHSSTEALASLQQYIRHLEELLLSELGAKEFTRRLESLQDRDAETLFIPEDNSRPRKRSAPAGKESGSSPKKTRSDSSASFLGHVSNLGRDFLDKAQSVNSDASASDVSPKASRNSSVVEPCHKAVDQPVVLRSVRPRPQSRRGARSVMLPNTQPSSNFHSGSSSTARTSQTLHPAQRSQKQHATMPTRKDTLQPEGASKKIRTAPMSPTLHKTSYHHTSPNPFPKSTTSALSRKPAFPTTQKSTFANRPLSLTIKPMRSVNKFSSSASSNLPSSPSRRSSISHSSSSN